jgi:NAD-dependent dihydropyrimidine dehydrogenase PreA subunit
VIFNRDKEPLMERDNQFKPVLFWLILMAFVLSLSTLSTRLWGEKPEKIGAPRTFTIQEDMTIAEFGQVNQVPNPVLKKVFSLASKEDLQKKIKDLNRPPEEISGEVNRALALETEEESKNWVKIPIKFALWILFLGGILFIIKNHKMTPAKRKWSFFFSMVIFGIILGSDPSPMGTVKDAIVLFGKSRVIFPPRMLAFTLFLGMVFLANKFICSWGCQFGTLQDLVFRFNRDSKDRKGLFRQFKPPFWISNTVRIAVFGVLTLVAFAWATDILESIDPFKVYNPLKLGTIGLVFVGGVSLVSLFVYRPWCHFFCPFGLVGWLVEKISLFKINVNYETCIACEACAKACPSTVMNAILKQEQTVPDCFACATCIHTCPTNSIHFEAKKRNKPPSGKFEKHQ